MNQAGLNRWCQANTEPFADLFLNPEERARNWEHDFDSSVSSAEEEGEIWRGDKRLDRMLRFVDSLKAGERFFICEHMADTHFPWRRTTDSRAKALGFEHGLEFAEKDALLDGKPWDKQGRYYQTVTRMDGQVGALINRLKERGLYANTLFVVVGDHGCQWFEHEHGYYVSHLYEQSLLIPVIIRVPGLAGGRVADVPVLQVDLLPTLAELAGLRRTGHAELPGRSLVPLLTGPTAPELKETFSRRDVLLTTHFNTVGVIEGFRYKLIVERAFGTYLLFDLERDPMERTNLADSEPQLLEHMKKRLRRLATENAALLGSVTPPGPSSPPGPEPQHAQ